MPYTNSGQAGTSGVGHLTALASEAWGFLNHSTDLWLAGLATPRPGTVSGNASTQRRWSAHARRNSKFYRDLYRGLPPAHVTLEHLPVVTKSTLIGEFRRLGRAAGPEAGRGAAVHAGSDPDRAAHIWGSMRSGQVPARPARREYSSRIHRRWPYTKPCSRSATGTDARSMLRSISGGSRFAYAGRGRRAFFGHHDVAPDAADESVDGAPHACDLGPSAGGQRERAGWPTSIPQIMTSYASELVALAEQQREGRLALKLTASGAGARPCRDAIAPTSPAPSAAR